MAKREVTNSAKCVTRPLRRVRRRLGTLWQTRDGQYEFMQNFDDKLWNIYRTGDDDVATYDWFDTLREAVSWVERHG